MSDTESPARQCSQNSISEHLSRGDSVAISDITTTIDTSSIASGQRTPYFSARGSIFSSSISSTSTGLQSQLGATWKQAFGLTMNSGFGSGTPRTEGYKGVREGREKGVGLPRIKGLGRTGKGPAKVPREMVEAAQMQRIEERVREMKFVRAVDFGKAIQREFEQVGKLDELDDDEGAEVLLNGRTEELFDKKMKIVMETFTSLEHYWMEHASVAKEHPSDVVAGNWWLNGAKLSELEEKLIFLLKNSGKEREQIVHTVAEVEYFRAKRIEREKAQAESGD